jgi:hypothetical protein
LGFVVEKMALEQVSFQVLQFWHVTYVHILTLHTHSFIASFFNPSKGSSFNEKIYKRLRQWKDYTIVGGYF